MAPVERVVSKVHSIYTAVLRFVYMSCVFSCSVLFLIPSLSFLSESVGGYIGSRTFCSSRHPVLISLMYRLHAVFLSLRGFPLDRCGPHIRIACLFGGLVRWYMQLFFRGVYLQTGHELPGLPLISVLCCVQGFTLRGHNRYSGILRGGVRTVHWFSGLTILGLGCELSLQR